ncbi:hypothetical protein F4774DRAFT_396629 [Daldinia eschscholtzii]|nr:hypothetical protein F4774DRAFT_396629 [Daldinia eschscholtzii]
MVDSRPLQPSRLLTSWCVAATILSYVSMVRGIDFPATVEVDLIYPRNGTFAPSVLTPIVFSIRNPQLASPLDLNLQWDIYRNDRPLGEGPWTQASKNLRWVDFSNVSDPYIAYSWTGKLNVETTWWIRWGVLWGNCSRSPDRYTKEGMASTTSFKLKNNVVEFTTKNGSTELDLASVNRPGDDTCGNVTDTRVTFNVTGVLDTPDPSKYDDRETCAVLAPPSNVTIPPPTRTCGAEIDASTASSILAAITATVCAGLPGPDVSCPPESLSSATRSKGVLSMAGATSWLMSLLFASVIHLLVS